MRAECYQLFMYCDVKNCRAFGMGRPDEFTGPNKTDCHKQARRDGWRVGKTDVCPLCNNANGNE